jgi:hypothetical protein
MGKIYVNNITKCNSVSALSLIAMILWSISLPAIRMDLNLVQDYDYHTPEGNISPVSLGMGGINLTYPADYFSPYDNPALLATNTSSAAATSFIIKQNAPATFADMMNSKTLLKDKQFLYYSVITKQAAWTYQPVAAVHVSQLTTTTDGLLSEYFDYQLDKIQLSIAGKDEEYTNLAGGLNIRYLTGRLVKLTQRKVGNNWVTAGNLIDDKVKGVSGDLGFTWAEGNFVWGSCIYDIYSRLWWENYDSESLKRRAAMGFQYNMDKLALLASVQGRVSNDPQTTYHLGLIKNWIWKTDGSMDTPGTEQNLLIRAGLYSRDFNGTENINYTFGSGYNYNMFRIDFAMTNSGMRLKDSQYLFSVGVGIGQ